MYLLDTELQSPHYFDVLGKRVTQTSPLSILWAINVHYFLLFLNIIPIGCKMMDVHGLH